MGPCTHEEFKRCLLTDQLAGQGQKTYFPALLWPVISQGVGQGISRTKTIHFPPWVLHSEMANFVIWKLLHLESSFCREGLGKLLTWPRTPWLSTEIRKVDETGRRPLTSYTVCLKFNNRTSWWTHHSDYKCLSSVRFWPWDPWHPFCPIPYSHLVITTLGRNSGVSPSQR